MKDPIRQFFLCLCAATAISLCACNAPAPRTDDSTPPSKNEKEIKTIKDTDCAVGEATSPDNRFLLRDLQRLVVLSVKEENPSGVLKIYNATDCTEVNSIALPENESPDFPYYLAEIMYNNQSKLIGIRGFDRVILYDGEADKISQPIVPQFLLNRLAEDAETGRILRLEIWEEYLIGYARGKGTFVYDINDFQNPAAVLPIQEFADKQGRYSSLFLLPETDNRNFSQAVFPNYNEVTEVFEMVAVFKKPRRLTVGKPVSATEIILRDEEKGEDFIIDLRMQKIEEK